MSKIILDIATLKSVKKVLQHGSAPPKPVSGGDLYLVALGTLVDAIVLFDEIYVPNLGHQKFDDVFYGLGDAIQPLSLDDHYRDVIAGAAIRWLDKWTDIEDHIRLLGSHSLDKHSQRGGFEAAST